MDSKWKDRRKELKQGTAVEQYILLHCSSFERKERIGEDKKRERHEEHVKIKWPNIAFKLF